MFSMTRFGSEFHRVSCLFDLKRGCRRMRFAPRQAIDLNRCLFLLPLTHEVRLAVLRALRQRRSSIGSLRNDAVS
jgi:hypothetical protein